MNRLPGPLLRLTVSLALLAIVYRGMDWEALGGIVVNADRGLVGLFLVSLFVQTALSSAKWQRLLRSDGIRVPYPSVLRTYWISSFLCLFLPSSIGGDGYRVLHTARQSRRTVSSFTSVVTDRLTGLFALTLLAAGVGLPGLLFLPVPGQLAVPLALLAAAPWVALALLRRAIVRRLARLAGARLWRRAGPFVIGLSRSLRRMVRSRALFVRVLGLALLFHATGILAVYFLAQALHLGVPALAFFVFMPVMLVIESVPISVYGLGVRDANFVFFFGLLGVPADQSLALALARLALTVIYLVPGGILLAARGPEPSGAGARVGIDTLGAGGVASPGAGTAASEIVPTDQIEPAASR